MTDLEQREAAIDATLKPCPFCGGKAWVSRDDHGKARWVACDDCEANGPMRDCNEAAIIANWNHRITA